MVAHLILVYCQIAGEKLYSKYNMPTVCASLGHNNPITYNNKERCGIPRATAVF